MKNHDVKIEVPTDKNAAYKVTTSTTEDCLKTYLRFIGIVNAKEVVAVQTLLENSKKIENGTLLFWGTQADLQIKAGTSNKPVADALKKLELFGLIEKRPSTITIKESLTNTYKKIKACKPVKVAFELICVPETKSDIDKNLKQIKNAKRERIREILKEMGENEKYAPKLLEELEQIQNELEELDEK